MRENDRDIHFILRFVICYFTNFCVYTEPVAYCATVYPENIVSQHIRMTSFTMPRNYYAIIPYYKYIQFSQR